MGGLGDMLQVEFMPFEEARSSDDIIVEVLSREPEGTVTILALGPMANLQAAEAKSPGILRRAKEVACMAGAFEVPGNITAAAEFNVLHNPGSYNDVMHAVDLVYLPLDATNKLLFTPAMVARMKTYVEGGREFSDAAKNLYGFCSALFDFQVTQNLNFKQSAGAAGMLMHDSAVVAYLAYPHTFAFRRGRIFVETQGVHSKGRTFVDKRLAPSASTNGWYANDVDAVSVMTAFVEDVQSLLEAL
uniref:Inosine/uridine-preferring nucleoside hydrolase domain-containing protein n=2 Tax=Phaeomonas parva TaxID=124430 RepID=A0A7S1XWL5_9STRA|mmetsp:Transcript_4038/g.11788  ORF Transcript_4038/g.11788 Transcript_4038/m.11788 type:complete len:245 (+) Transcript_4038:493-1227(+)